MPKWWRRWMPGPKHGLARGVAVFGNAGRNADPEQVAGLLGRCDQLYRWAARHGVALTGVPDDLARLDQAIDEWGSDPQVASALGNDAGLFLGSVLVSSIPGARWLVWPNGHPVVRLGSGRELDVVASAHDRVRGGTPRLQAVYADAADDRRR